MIIHLPRRRKHFPDPTAIPDIERVDKMNILGITVSDTLTFHHHISVFVAKSACSFYALKTIHAHGLNGNCTVGRNSHYSGLTTPMQALPGGDISKPTKGTGFSSSSRRPYSTVISPAR